MLGGTYFYYCTETSTKHKQVFRYRYLSVEENGSDLLGKDQHPVFLMINANSVSFYISPPPHQNINLDKTCHLLLLFSIPLYPKGSKLDKLTEVVINLYEEKAMVVSAYNLVKKEPVKNNQYNIYSDEKEGDYRVIFQHFLYDLSFSDVFQNATHHDEALIHLRENYFVNCIIAKSENKYWEHIYSKDQYNQQYIQTKYWEADRNWINLIVEEKSNELLEISDWFKGAEQELQAVLKSEHRKRLLNAEKDKNRIKEIKIQRDSIYHFFLQRFNTLSIEGYLGWYNTRTYIVSILVLCASIGLFFFHLRAEKNVALYIALFIVVLGIVQGVFRPLLFLASNVLSKIHINYYNHSIGYPRMSLAIIAIWLGYIPVCEEAWQINITLSNAEFVFFFASFIVTILMSIFYFVNDIQYGSTKGKAVYKSLALFAKGMAISMAFGVFAMEISRENIFSAPSDFLPKEGGILKIDRLTQTMDSLKLANFVLKDSASVASLDSLLEFKEIAPKGESGIVVGVSFDSVLLKFKEALIIKHADQHVKSSGFWNIPSIAFFRIDKVEYNFFVFPKLLFTYSAFAFFIGLFAQIAFQGSSYKEHL